MALNLGQVAGLHIGSTAPTNTNLIWFDNTPGVNLHKVYDFGSSQWVVLDQNIVISITYANLVILAQNSLTIGQWFKITDLGNLMAIALTATIVQYTDITGNIVLDDLGNSKQYIVTTNNLTIDNLHGIFNAGTLNFDFQPYNPSPLSSYQYLLAEDKVGGLLRFIKIKFADLLSSDNNNALAFGSDGGFFLDLTTAISNIYDIAGGVVAYDTYIQDITNLSSQITNIASSVSNSITTLTSYINTAVSPVNIYSKRVPNVNTNIAPSDIISNDTLQTIVNKTQRWINNFKTAKGIDIDPTWDNNYNHGWINNNDTIQTALQKLQYIMQHFSSIGCLSAGWHPEDYTQHINNLAALDNFDLAFGKLQGKLNQIGDIENGVVTSKSGITTLGLGEGTIMIKDSTSLFPGFITINSNNEGAYIFDRASSFVYKGALTNNATGTYGRNIKSGVAALCKQHSALVGEISAAISARLEKPQTLTEWATIYTNNIDIYDAFFQDLRADMLSLKTTFVLPNLSIYMIGDETFVHISDPSNIISNGDIYLPSQYKQGTGGRVIFLIVTETNTPPTLQSNGGYIVDNFVSPTPSYLQTYQLSNGVLYMIVATNKRYNNGTVWYIKNIG